MSLARLSDRSLVKVVGEEARAFLDRLVTCDLEHLAPASARYGALLTPQGKIISDFVAFDARAIDDEAIFLDVTTTCATDLIKRLSMYKLRAKVAVSDVTEAFSVLAGWGETSPPTGEHHLSVPDPRLRRLGWRAVVGRDGLMDSGAPKDGEDAYHAHRVALGIPEGGRDFAFNDAFPHEALMDQLHGIDFEKGCYIGQEVVSRMQHRGTARTRIVSLAIEGGAGAEAAQDVMAGERSVGRVGTAFGEHALAMMRLDRAADALASGAALTVGGAAIRFAKPDWVRFPYPHEMPAAAQ